MEKVRVNLENCYGIRKLEYNFDFRTKRVYAVYSPNGVMKTSFAKTFKDISNNAETQDLIFPERKTKRQVKDESNSDITGEQVFVIEPYNESFKSEKLSTLLVNSKLKEQYEKIHSEIDDKKETFLKELKSISGIKSEIEETISEVFTKIPKSFFKAMLRIEPEVLDGSPPEFPDIVYKNIFNDKVESFLQTKDFKSKLSEYISKYHNLIDASIYFKRGVFNHNNASVIAKNLKENGFFKASHSVSLNNKTTKKEITTEKELEEVIEKEKQSILNNPELVAAFDEVDKKLSANKELRDFRDYLLENMKILPELSHPEAFKEKLWISYFKTKIDLFKLLIAEYKVGKEEIEKIVEQAKKEVTEWRNVIDEFNKRFSVPFRLSVGNQEDVILKREGPSVKFEFFDSSDSRTVEERELLSVLSTGEKRALYLLNIIFEVEARRKSRHETLFIVDDIADSFDYKNKYAIIEYLKDISENDFFNQIVLTHNYDFYRTISGRLDMSREFKLNTSKTESSVKLIVEKYQKNPFSTWKKYLHENNSMMLASIPFVRNLAEYCGDDPVFQKLTSLLHFKEDSAAISVSELEVLFKSILKDKQSITLPNQSKKVLDIIFETADAICSDANEIIELENKIVLAMAIRLKSEVFMVKRIADDAFWRGITANQSYFLIAKFKELFPSETKAIKLLQQVNLMTPENIHINSFMYEPILDMSNQHLKSLLTEVKALVP